MRTAVLGAVSVTVLAICALFGTTQNTEPVKLRLRLVDAKTGDAVAGIVRVTVRGNDNPAELPGLYPRLRGVKTSPDVAGWHVVPAAGADTTLPRDTLRLEALSGLETAVTTLEADLRKNAPQELVIKLAAVFRPED